MGGGAAGIIAAYRSGSLGARTALLEKTSRLGTKILISGGGKCNITHNGEIEDVLSAFPPEQARFLRPAAYRFGNRDIIALLERHGIEVHTRPNGRVFPTSGNAKDVVEALSQCLEAAKVETHKACPAVGLLSKNGTVTGVKTANGPVVAKQTVLAAGGSSYPASGTTGEAWGWCESLGHQIIRIRAALAPIYLQSPLPLAGVSLRDCALHVNPTTGPNKKWRGELLFTHKGLSGPVALECSQFVAERLSQEAVELTLDLIPRWQIDELDGWMVTRIRAAPRKTVADLVPSEVPTSVARVILAASGCEPGTLCANLPGSDRRRLGWALKAMRLGMVRAVPLEKGECVAGGVALTEVDAKTMCSLRARGLELCGELLDLNGPVGGYNLFAAFATGHQAGETAAKLALGREK